MPREIGVLIVRHSIRILLALGVIIPMLRPLRMDMR
jgi:hypothetical protein